ncbi:ribonuclease H family protein [Clostridium sp. SM-530-WT-3G]|uniref:ribonuclease H family protein n=1 Tax=Clostridium sp. SM-530-WT-3G TaxID=2725303 RepID=UPI00145D2DA4|nr:ribonuclease H family protein [Clostridium sp. SM-530-WT-3G]NME81858.1 reverse transcriptase-like protein [Clostridium sp. SM-530-WT-3G]
MAKKNFYAVKVGRRIGILKTWEECLESVSAYPNAKYKGFSTREEAEAYLNDTKIETKQNSEFIKSINESEDDNKIYYAVKNGRKIGLFTTWEECKQQINGYSGADYKKIQGKIAALRYINPNIVIKKKISEKKRSHKKDGITKKGYDVKAIRSKADVKCSKTFIDPKELYCEYEFIAFVDGSYDKDTKTYGAGVVVLDKNGSYNTYSKAGHDEWDQWNIVGELEATKLAISKAKELGTKDVAIYHDLKNIALWASGEWQAKNKYTQEYVRFVEEASKEMNIYFIKVKGHSDECIYNDLADEAAKNAIKEYGKYN